MHECTETLDEILGFLRCRTLSAVILQYSFSSITPKIKIEEN